MEELLEKMLEREKYLKDQKNEVGHSFNPKERSGELKIWILELGNHVTK